MKKRNPENIKKKKQIGNRKAGSRKQSEKNLEVSLIRSYPGQAIWQVWLAATPLKLTTTVTTGLIAAVFQVEAANISSFGTRFGSTFVEYRIVRAKFKIRFFSSTNPGVVQFFLDEKSSAVPTLAEARERATLICSASSVDSTPMIKWVSADPLDLQYVAIGTTNTVLATFKMYTDNTNFGSSIVATDYFEVEPMFQFQFRGLQGA